MRKCKFLWIVSLVTTTFCTSSRVSPELRSTLLSYGQILSRYNGLLEKNIEEQNRINDSRYMLDEKREFRRLQAEKKKMLLQSIKPGVNPPISSLASDWLRMKLLLAGDQPAEALSLCDSLIRSNSPLASGAKWEKVKILNRLNRIQEAFPLFRQIEPLLPKDADLYATYLFFALNAAEPSLRREYADKFLKEDKLPECLKPQQSRIYLEMAREIMESGDAKKAREMLGTALARERHSSWQIRLKDEITHLDMVGKPAPILSRENWLNQSAPSGMQRTRTPRAILFWAHWCESSSQELLFLKGLADRFGARGLGVLACTKLYGSEVTSEGRAMSVSMADESRELQNLLARLHIPYPVLVSTEGKDFNSFQITVVPSLVLVDRAGMIADILIPTGDHEAIIKSVSRMLGE